MFGCGFKSCATEDRESWELVQGNYYRSIIPGKAVLDRNDKGFTIGIVDLYCLPDILYSDR